jgi:GntR family transcriptional regulator
MIQVSVIEIDSRDSTPIYAQIDRALRAAIASGRLRIGDQLPTVRQLAVDLEVNANTVARVYVDLERQGVLETRRGVGSFVTASPSAARPPSEHQRRLRAFVTRVLSDAAREGFTLAEVVDALDGHKPRKGA